MRLWHFDRLGGIASERFDINEEGLRFVSAILGYLVMNEEQLVNAAYQNSSFERSTLTAYEWKALNAYCKTLRVYEIIEELRETYAIMWDYCMRITADTTPLDNECLHDASSTQISTLTQPGTPRAQQMHGTGCGERLRRSPNDELANLTEERSRASHPRKRQQHEFILAASKRPRIVHNISSIPDGILPSAGSNNSQQSPADYDGTNAASPSPSLESQDDDDDQGMNYYLFFDCKI